MRFFYLNAVFEPLIKKLSFPRYTYIYTYVYLPTCLNLTRSPFIFFHFRRCYFCSAKRLFIFPISQMITLIFISKQQQQQHKTVKSEYIFSVLHVTSEQKQK